MTRREWLAIGGAALLGACGPKKGSGYRGYALIATSGQRSLAVVDLTEFKVKRPIELGASPTAVVAGPKASYVLTPETGSIQVIDRELKKVQIAKIADDLSEIRLNKDGDRLLAISAQSKELIEADAASLRAIRRYPLAAEPIGIDVASNSLVAVSTGDQGFVQLVDLASGRTAATNLSAKIGAVRFRADSEVLLVANRSARSLTALNVPDLKVMADLPLAMQPDNLCFNYDQGQLFVTGEGMDGLAIVFPFGILEVEQTVLAGRDPGVMACSNGTPSYLFVGSHSGTDVCILDVYSRAMLGVVETGQTPTYIAITPDNQYALVLDQGSGDLAVIHIGGIRRDPDDKRHKSGAALFTLLPVGEKPVHAAIVPRVA